MRPTSISKTGTGTTAWVPVDYAMPYSVISLAVVVSGTITYTVECTFDDVFDSGVTPTAFAHGTLAAQTTNQSGTYVAPIRAVRLNNTAGTGTTTMTIIQGRK